MLRIDKVDDTMFVFGFFKTTIKRESVFDYQYKIQTIVDESSLILCINKTGVKLKKNTISYIRNNFINIFTKLYGIQFLFP